MKQSPHSEQARGKLVGALIVVGIIVVTAVVAGVLGLSQPVHQNIPAPEVSISTSSPAIDISYSRGDTHQPVAMQALARDIDKPLLSADDGTCDKSPGYAGQVCNYTTPDAHGSLLAIQMYYSGTGSSHPLAPGRNGSEDTLGTNEPGITHTNQPAITRTASVTGNSPAPAFPGILPPSRIWGLPVIPTNLSRTGSRQSVISEPAPAGTTGITRTNGVINPGGVTTVNYGSSKTFTITPDTGYHVADVLINGESVGAVTSYTFINVHTNHTIRAQFGINTYMITPTAGYGGSISPRDPVTTDYGSSVKVTVAPDIGYHITDVRVDGKSQGAITDYTFPDIRSDHTIATTFAINMYTIDASPGRGGTITPSGAVQVSYGSSPTFSIAPDTGYHTTSVTVDGNDAGILPQYTFNNVVSPHTISATFVVDPVIVHLTPVRGRQGTVQKFIITGTGFVPQGKTRVALFYPGTSTIFVEGESIQMTSPGHLTGQFILPESPSIRFYDLRLTNPDGSSDIRPSGFEVI